jgi:hypothetical protein
MFGSTNSTFGNTNPQFGQTTAQNAPLFGGFQQQNSLNLNQQQNTGLFGQQQNPGFSGGSFGNNNASLFNN